MPSFSRGKSWCFPGVSRFRSLRQAGAGRGEGESPLGGAADAADRGAALSACQSAPGRGRGRHGRVLWWWKKRKNFL